MNYIKLGNVSLQIMQTVLKFSNDLFSNALGLVGNMAWDGSRGEPRDMTSVRHLAESVYIFPQP